MIRLPLARRPCPPLAGALIAAATLILPVAPIADARAADGDVSVHGHLQRWHRVAIDLEGPAAAETADPNPFLDHRYQVRLDGPDGQVLDVPGFFAGDGQGGTTGDTWRAYFSPGATGTWRYTISFRSGERVAVDVTGAAGMPADRYDGLSGTFEVAESDRVSPDFRAPGRGLLRNRGGHFLTFADGEPFHYAGAGIPENLLGYRGFDNTQGGIGHEFTIHAEDFRAGDPNWTSIDGGDGRALIGALNYIARQGGNTLYFLPMNLGGDGKDTFPMIAPDEPVRYDLSKLHQWEIALRHAQALGIFFVVMLAETESDNEYFWDGGAQSLGPERKLFYRMINALMGHHNGLKYVISEETSYPFDLRNEFMAYLKEPSLNPYDHPVSFHTGFETDPDSYFDHGGNTDLDTTSTQGGFNGGSMFRYAEKIRDETESSAQPLVAHFDEPQKIENDNDDFDAGYPHGRRNKMWPFFMGGGSGFSWYIQKDGGGHGFDQRIEDFTIMGNALQWSRNARVFFSALPVRQMATSEALASSAGGDSTFALYDPDRVYAIYNSGNGGPFELDLSAASGRFEVTWFDPRGGTYEAGPVAMVDGGGTVDLGVAPDAGDRDWAVVVARAGSGLGVARPVADAGPDLEVSDSDGDGRETVALDGSGSHGGGGVVAHRWRVDGEAVATGATATVALELGVHRVTLEVEGAAGTRASDEVEVTVAATGGDDGSGGGAGGSGALSWPLVVLLLAWLRPAAVRRGRGTIQPPA